MAMMSRDAFLPLLSVAANRKASGARVECYCGRRSRNVHTSTRARVESESLKSIVGVGAVVDVKVARYCRRIANVVCQVNRQCRRA